MSACDLIKLVRALEADHGQGGWPAVEMATLSALADEVESLRAANEAFGRRQKWWTDKMFDAEQALARLRSAAEQARAALSDLLATRDPVVYSDALAALDAALGPNVE